MRNQDSKRGDRLVRRCATSQYGLFTTAQAQSAGLSRSALVRRHQAGVLDLVLPGVWMVAGTPPSWEQTMMAGLLHLGDRSAVSYRAAARRWGLQGFDNAPCEISSATRQASNHLKTNQGQEIRLHRVGSKLLEHMTYIEPWRITSLPRTILDLAGKKHPLTSRALDQALREKKTTIADLWKLYEGPWIRRRWGAAILRELLMARSPAESLSESELEDLMVQVLRDGGFPPWQQQFPMTLPSGPIRIDFAYPEVLVAIECDSYMWHMDEEAFRRDRRRDAELQALGWVVLRFTWRQIRYERGFVQEQIRRVLRLRSVDC